MTRILYLAHDLDDSAIWRRVGMLRAGGATVDLAGFQRSTTPLREPATVLGQTHNGRFLHRGLSALRSRRMADALAKGPAPDVILARNLEMLPLARRLRKAYAAPSPRLVYEVLDIHRLLIGPGLVPSALRRVERHLCRDVDKVLISSARFDQEHFRRHGQTTAPILLVENKVWDPKAADAAPQAPRPPRPADGPLVIGWFGILRCTASLHLLDTVTRQAQGRLRVILRGRPALDVLPDFQQVVEANPHLSFQGAYRYPEDLPRIYGEVDIAWLIDRYEAGANSDWLLPNRLYESCAHGAIPLALQGTETAAYLNRRGLGLATPDLQPNTLATLLSRLDPATLAEARAAIAATDPADWRSTRDECTRLVAQLAEARTAPHHPAALAKPAESAG